MVVIRGDSSRQIIGAEGSGPMQFVNPVNVGEDSDHIYVADIGNNRIVALNRPGSGTEEYTSAWVSTGKIALSQASSVAAARTPIDNNIYIADTGNDQVHKYLLPRADPALVWTAARANLIAGNIEGALTSFASKTRTDYRELFTSLGTAVTTEWVSEVGELNPVYNRAAIAQSEFVVLHDGVPITFFVNFVKENGQWKIAEF